VALVALLLLVTGGVQRGIIPLPPAIASILPFAPSGTQQSHPPTPSGATEAAPTADALQTGAPMSQQMDIVLARQLAAQALERRETRPDLALLLSVEANRLLHEAGWQPDRPTHRLAVAEARSSLLTLLQAHPDLMMFLRGHSGIVSSVAFSPDGSLLASGSCAITRTAELAASADAAASAAPLPGRTACSGGEIQLWRVAAPTAAQRGAAGHASTSALQHITTLHGHSDGITSLAFSPDSSLLASSSGDNTIIIWDVERGDPVAAPLQGHTEPVTTLAFSPDGSLLGSAGWDETIILWDIASKQPLGQPLRGHTNSINTLTFSPDGSLLASGSWDGSIILWDVANRVPLGEPLQGHAFAVSSVAFSPDGSRLASGGIDAAVVLWDVQSRRSVVVSAPAEQQAPPGDAAGHALPVHRVTFSPDGQLLASADEAGTILLWDIAAGAPAPSPLHRYTLPPLHDYATVETAVPPLISLDFSPDSRTLASSSGGKAVLLWDVSERARVAGGHLRHALAAPAPTQQQHTCVAFSPAGPAGHTIATGNADTSITLWSGMWNSVSGTLTHTAALSATANPLTLQGHTNGVTSVAFSPDGALLASGSLDDTILVWDLQAAQAVTETQQPPPPGEIAPLDPPLQGHTDGVTDIAFSPDGSLLASASLDGSVLLWDTQTWTPREPPLQGHAFAVYRVAFSPDGSLLATGGKDTTVIVWDLATNQPLGAPLEGHTEAVHALAFSPDGSLLASRSSDNVIILWDMESRQGVALPASMPAAQGQQSTTSREGYPAMSLTFSADGRMLASGDSSGNLILWDVATHQPLGSLLQGGANSSSERIAATFNADGTLLAAVRMWQATGGDAPPAPDAAAPPRETLLLWDTSIAAWQQHACRIANRSLTHEEWQRFLGEERDYRQTCTAAPTPPGHAP
jgi:WD40 repeat protein